MGHHIEAKGTALRPVPGAMYTAGAPPHARALRVARRLRRILLLLLLPVDPPHAFADKRIPGEGVATVTKTERWREASEVE